MKSEGITTVTDFTRIVNFFNKETVSCFTSDLDWSPEWAIQEMLRVFDKLEVPLTIFITHHSKVIKKIYGKPGKSQYVGLHPNFFPKSSHGTNSLDIIEFCQKFWPDAKCFRSHGFFDNSKITKEFYARGFKYDSNLCLFLHPCCTPLRHSSGLIRFPVFWEDDTHIQKGLPLKIDIIKRDVETPGLKIFNFHPLSLAINAPTKEYYAKNKFLLKARSASSWRKYVFDGTGERTFLEELISHLKKMGVHFYYLDDLFRELPELAER